MIRKFLMAIIIYAAFVAALPFTFVRLTFLISEQQLSWIDQNVDNNLAENEKENV